MAKKPVDEKSLRAEIETARAEYEAAVVSEPAHVAAEKSKKVKTLIGKLAAALASGADVCPKDGSAAIGMRRKAGLYEVGCLACANRAQGETAAEAVENWNAGEYVAAAA